MPEISVIVPVYNVEPYLHRCVDSILAQTFTDFELILVDDGSPDNCGAICDEYAAKDSRVRVIHQKNGGLSAARNTAIDWSFANSDSQWLSFIDSDDWVHPQYLEYLYRGVTENKTSMSACDYLNVNEYKEPNKVEYSVSVLRWDKLYVAKAGIGVITCNKLYAKRLFDNVRYPVRKLHEDEFVSYKLEYKAGDVAFVRAKLYYYWLNPNSITRKAFTLQRMNAIEAINEQRAFAREIGNEMFYAWCTRKLVEKAGWYIKAIKESDVIEKSDKRKAINYLHKTARGILINEGRVIAPINEYPALYNSIFPIASECYWILYGVKRKIEGMIRGKSQR